MNTKQLVFSTLILCMALLPLEEAIADQSVPTALTLEEIVSLKRVRTAHMSPNDDAIAYLLSVPRTLYEDEDGEAWVQLHVVNLEGDSRPYFSGKVEVSRVAWSVDGNKLYFVAQRDEEAEYPDIFQMSLHGGEATVLYKAQSNIKGIYPSPDGTRLAFLATDAPPTDEDRLKDLGFKAVVYEESKDYTHVFMLDMETGEAPAHKLPGSVSGFALRRA